MVNYFATTKLLFCGLYHLNSWFISVRVPIFILVLGWRFGKSTSYMGYSVTIQITALHSTLSMYYS